MPFLSARIKRIFSLPLPASPASILLERARAPFFALSLSERVRFSSKYTQVASVCVYIHGTNDAF